MKIRFRTTKSGHFGHIYEIKVAAALLAMMAAMHGVMINVPRLAPIPGPSSKFFFSVATSIVDWLVCKPKIKK